MNHITKLEDIPRIDGQFYYLSTPYTHPDPVVVYTRMLIHDKIDAKLMALGHYTMCPMEKHYKLMYENLPNDYGYWRNFCLAMLKRCNGIIVITSEGWESSRGVIDEVEHAMKWDLPVYYIGPV